MHLALYWSHPQSESNIPYQLDYKIWTLGFRLVHPVHLLSLLEHNHNSYDWLRRHYSCKIIENVLISKDKLGRDDIRYLNGLGCFDCFRVYNQQYIIDIRLDERKIRLV
jgi:hypothetical protein